MADTTIKPEIKVDPAASTPQSMRDVAEFGEEVHDLQFPPGPGEPGSSQAWLVKLPKYLWQHWADIYRNMADDVPIEIGKMRVKTSNDPDLDPLKQKIQISLTPGVPQHRGLPMKYDLNLKTNGYSGTVIFSEKDAPGEDSSKRGPSNRGSKPSGIQSKNDRYGRDRPAVKAGTYRTAIDRNTALAPVIHHVADALPHEDDSYFKFAKKQYLASTRPKTSTTFTSKIDKSLHPSARGNLGAFNAFGLSSRPTSKKKPTQNKAVRIPQGELLDALDKCFRRYKYWSLKALRNELKQPEAYIKQTLEEIAVLVRSGDFAMNYILRPEYTTRHEIKEEDVKQEHVDVGSEDEGGSGMGSASGEESEDEEGFEDVKMEG